MTELPAVNDILKASQSLGLGASPAELHGGLCGWLAAGGADLPAWPGQVLADASLPVPEPGSVLDQLRLATVAQLAEARERGAMTWEDRHPVLATGLGALLLLALLLDLALITAVLGGGL
jgi:uncharacterized protein YgfB (UPF0149 family)